MNSKLVKLFTVAVTLTIVMFVLSATIIGDLLSVYSWFVCIVVSLPLFLLGFVLSRKYNNRLFKVLNLVAISFIVLFGISVIWLISILPGA